LYVLRSCRLWESFLFRKLGLTDGGPSNQNIGGDIINAYSIQIIEPANNHWGDPGCWLSEFLRHQQLEATAQGLLAQRFLGLFPFLVIFIPRELVEILLAFSMIFGISIRYGLTREARWETGYHRQESCYQQWNPRNLMAKASKTTAKRCPLCEDQQMNPN
jgi:hypothetical protein